MNSDLPTPPADAPWEKVAAATRADRAARGNADEQAPFGFSTRIVAAWQEIRRNERAALWAKWSLRAAFCSMAIAALVVALQRPERNDTALLPLPAYELP